MIVLGIDPAAGGSKTAALLGLAIVDTAAPNGSLLWSRAVRLSGATIEERVQDAARAVHEAFMCSRVQRGGYPVGLVAVESVHTRINSRTAVELAYVAGAALCEAGNTHTILVQPSQAKQVLTGLGNADKPTMVAMAVARGWTLPGSKSAREAQADAAAVALCGAGVWQQRQLENRQP